MADDSSNTPQDQTTPSPSDSSVPSTPSETPAAEDQNNQKFKSQKLQRLK